MARPIGARLVALLQVLEDAPGSEVDLACCLFPQHVQRLREMLTRLQSLGYCRKAANGSRWSLTERGRQRLSGRSELEKLL